MRHPSVLSSDEGKKNGREAQPSKLMEFSLSLCFFSLCRRGGEEEGEGRAQAEVLSRGLKCFAIAIPLFFVARPG